MSEKEDIKFVDGMIFKRPPAAAPRFVMARVSIKRQELIAWLQAQEGDWLNLDVKESKGGKWYAALDGWTPDPSKKAA